MAESAEHNNDGELLDERADVLARPPVHEPLASEFLELLTFRSGKDLLAIETRFVCEVLKNVDVTPLPGRNGPLVGVTNLRGEVLAVMTISPLLNAATAAASTNDELGVGRWVIVLGLENAQFGITVTEVTEVAGVPNSGILDPSRQSRISDSQLVRGVTEDARIILDGQAVLDDSQLVIDEHEN
jgi:purine-binding chemotaxis protein CheW